MQWLGALDPDVRYACASSWDSSTRRSGGGKKYAAFKELETLHFSMDFPAFY
jgi:hypothetical protein